MWRFSRLSAEATPEQRKEVERLAGALHDEQEKIKNANKARERENQLRAEGKALTDQLRTAEEAYADEIERLNELLDAGAIDKETFARASEQADDRMLQSSREWSDGVRRAIHDYLDEATDAAKTFEQATTRALKASEDAFVEWAMTGKFSAKDLFNTIAEEALEGRLPHGGGEAPLEQHPREHLRRHRRRHRRRGSNHVLRHADDRRLPGNLGTHGVRPWRRRDRPRRLPGPAWSTRGRSTPQTATTAAASLAVKCRL